MINKDVFISYKSEEFDEANAVRMHLEENGINCWMAPMCIIGGASYASEIPQGIHNCKVFVLILSKKCQESKWVPRELDQAINENKIILPFMIEKCALIDEFRFYLTNVQTYFAYKNRQEYLDNMTSDIKSLLGIVDVAEDEPETEEKTAETVLKYSKKVKNIKPKKVKKKKSSKRKLIPLAICCSIVILIALIVIFSKSNNIIIGDKKFEKSDTYVYINDVTLTDSDIKNLSKFKELNMIDFSDCVIECEDLSIITSHDLYSLDLSNCNLNENQIKSLKLQDETSIKELYLAGNPGFTDLAILRNFAESLNILDVSNTGISDISVLQVCLNLTELYLNCNKISSVEPLSGCPNLEVLAVNNNSLSSLKGLENCLYLKELHAGSNNINSIDGLTNATLLEFVNLNDNSLFRVTTLEKSKDTLKKLFINNNNISNIDVVGQFSLLEYFSADNNYIGNIESLKNCTNLCGISLIGNNINDAGGISGCSKLNYINLSNNNLSEFSIEELESENVVFDLSNNNLSEFNLTATYRYLSLYGNEIAECAEVNGGPGSVLIVDYNENTDYNALKDYGFTNYKIVECPLDKQVEVVETLGSYNTECVSEADVAESIKEYTPDSIKDISQY